MSNAIINNNNVILLWIKEMIFEWYWELNTPAVSTDYNYVKIKNGDRDGTKLNRCSTIEYRKNKINVNLFGTND